MEHSWGEVELRGFRLTAEAGEWKRNAASSTLPSPHPSPSPLQQWPDYTPFAIAPHTLGARHSAPAPRARALLATSVSAPDRRAQSKHQKTLSKTPPFAVAAIAVVAALDQASRDRSIRTVVVTGNPAGKAFCAGADLSPGVSGFGGTRARRPGTPSSEVDSRQPASSLYRDAGGFSSLAALRCTKPVIAALNGSAVVSTQPTPPSNCRRPFA